MSYVLPTAESTLYTESSFCPYRLSMVLSGAHARVSRIQHALFMMHDHQQNTVQDGHLHHVLNMLSMKCPGLRTETMEVLCPT